MSFNSNVINISVPAGADLSAKQYTFVKVNSSAAAVSAGAGEAAIGVLQNNPGSGQTGSVQVFGVSKVKAGGNVTAGGYVASDANGKAVAATLGRTNTSDAGGTADALIGSNVMGIALGGGVDGDVIPVLLMHTGAAPTTAA